MIVLCQVLEEKKFYNLFMNFGEILKNLLRDTGKTQQELALFIGYSQRAVSKWINNQFEPTE